MDRFGNISAELTDEMLQNSKPANTKKTEQYVYRQFEEFCNARGYQLNGNTSNEELALILKDWAFNMRKKDGTEYKEGVVKTIWNLTAKMVQQKYFNEFNRTIDPFKDITFKAAVLAKNTKRKTLQAIPEKRKSSSAALTTENVQKILVTLDENTPMGLQRKFYHIAAIELAWRGGEAVSCLVNYFDDEVDNYGKKTGRIEYNSVFSKNAQGGNQRTTDSKWLRPNANNPTHCPVRLLRQMLSKRTGNIKTRRLFLTVNKDWNKYPNSCWYKNTPLGVNEIRKWTKLGAEAIGIDTKRVKITNHSNRSTTVSQLSSAGTSVHEIIKITGHTSTNSIQPYLQLSEEHHKTIISNLRKKQTDDLEKASSSTNATVSVPQIDDNGKTSNLTNATVSTPPNITYNNCTFNINY